MSDYWFLNPYLTSEPEPILRDVFDGWELGNGIFPFLELAATMPWAESETVDSSVLDIAYFGNHSGGKFCAPLVKLLIGDEGTIPAERRSVIAKIIVSKYLPNWDALWRTNVASYDPIHNYNMYEERNLATTVDNETVTDGTMLHSGTDSIQHDITEATTHGRTNDTTDYVYGLNSADADPRPSEKSESVEGGTTSTTTTGTDATIKNLRDDNDVTETLDGEGTEHEEIHRYGNIGVTTTQKLLQEERNLWLWNYFDQIFDDLDRELALAFHDSCRV